MGCRELSKDLEEETDDELSSALDRISNADSVDTQVDREIWRYWNDRVSSAKISKPLIIQLRTKIISMPDNTRERDFEAADNEAYNEGIAAYKRGCLKENNPYPKQTSMYESWAIGWCQGFDESFDEDMT